MKERDKPTLSKKKKTKAGYCIAHLGGGHHKFISANKLRVELDATFEHNGKIAIIEAKNRSPDDFAVYQLFHPLIQLSDTRK